MRRTALISALVIALGSSLFARTPKPQSKGTAPANQREKVSGTACVRAGVEAGCIMLTTIDGKITYDVVGSKTPKTGTVVRFSGTTEPGTVTICQQGIPVQLASFTVVRMKCPLEDKTQ